MNTTDVKVAPSPPSLIQALMAGFDAISNHVGLILFSIILDLILWLGPHLRLRQLVENIFDQNAALPEMQTAEVSEMMETSRELWMVLTERFNLFSALRSFPVGIPSLMVSRLPVDAPTGAPVIWEASSIGTAVAIWIGLTLAGLVVGALYFGTIADAALSGEVNWRKSLRHLPRTSLNILLLSGFWFILFVGFSLPFSCILSLFIVSGFNLGQFAAIFIGIFAAWMVLPLVFSPHGIFAYGLKMWESTIQGINLVRLTYFRTFLFLGIALLLSEGLDVLWKIPAESSWLAVIGVVGHAFVTSALLAASFVYYRDSINWVRKVAQMSKLTALKS